MKKIVYLTIYFLFDLNLQEWRFQFFGSNVCGKTIKD